jgi:hypothetical protein
VATKAGREAKKAKSDRNESLEDPDLDRSLLRTFRFIEMARGTSKPERYCRLQISLNSTVKHKNSNEKKT